MDQSQKKIETVKRFYKWIEGEEWNRIPWNLRQQIFSAGENRLPNRILEEKSNAQEN